MRYAIVEPNGLVIGLIDSNSYADAVRSAEGMGYIVPLTDTATDIGTRQYAVLDGSLAEIPPKPAPYMIWINNEWIDPRGEADLMKEIVSTRVNAITAINNAIGEIRSRFVTVIPAQDMLYQAKEAEAKAYLADPDPSQADYPFIYAEIGITGQDAWQVAQVYVNQALILRHTAAQFETVRLGHIAMVEAATDVGAVEAALSSFNQVVEAL